MRQANGPRSQSEALLSGGAAEIHVIKIEFELRVEQAVLANQRRFSGCEEHAIHELASPRSISKAGNGSERPLAVRNRSGEILIPVPSELRIDEQPTWLSQNTAPVSVAITKRLIWGLLGEDDMGKAEAADHKAFQWTGKQPDAHEGVTAFLQKRKPAWKMKPSTDFPDFIPEIK